MTEMGDDAIPVYNFNVTLFNDATVTAIYNSAKIHLENDLILIFVYLFRIFFKAF